jgi:hypothetical protein
MATTGSSTVNFFNCTFSWFLHHDLRTHEVAATRVHLGPRRAPTPSPAPRPAAPSLALT